MTVEPEDVRKHLATGTGSGGGGKGTGHDLAAAGESAAEGAAAGAATGGLAAVAKEAAIHKSISASYFGLRRGLAALALALPVLLWLAGGVDHLQGSISAYYHYSPAGTLRYGDGAARDIMVGILCAAGAALFFYKGYGWKENLALNIGGVAAVLIALAPMDWPSAALAQKSFLSLVHTGAAVVFFFAIAFVCLFCSGDTLKLMKEDDTRRIRFKRSYAVIGTLMIALPLTIVVLHYLMPRAEESYVTFAIEVAAIYVFAAFWLVKSREIALIQKL